MTKEQSNNKSSDFATRRRIIKGLTATPIIYTLSNGSALAAASAHQCLTNTPLDSEPECSAVSALSAPDSKWIWDQITDNDSGETRFCVRYVTEDTPFTASTYTVNGYDWRFTENNTLTHRFIDTGGISLGSTHNGNPLMVSCAASFL